MDVLFGERKVVIGPSATRDMVVCPVCNGEDVEQCVRCEGTGKRPTTRWDVEQEKYVANVTNANVAAALHNMGAVAQERGRLDEADQWYYESCDMPQQMTVRTLTYFLEPNSREIARANSY